MRGKGDCVGRKISIMDSVKILIHFCSLYTLIAYSYAFFYNYSTYFEQLFRMRKCEVVYSYFWGYKH